MIRALLFSCLTCLAATAPSRAHPEEQAVTTEHKARIDGRVYSYTAEAGRLPVRHVESSEIRGRMFYVSYRVPSSAPRPVIFSWGGGPSGPALGMQMTFGPKSFDENDDLIDNHFSLLSVADLVFVDPVGTGFSRPEKAEYGAEFFSTTGDGRSVAEFIRAWVATHDAELAPIYLAGQSYGVWRASIVAELLEISGRRVDGVILTSGGMGLADEFSDRTYELALRIPDYALTALHHRRLPEQFGASREKAWTNAENWARDIYGPALSRIDALTDTERETIAIQLAERTGYPLDKIDRRTLVFSSPEYRRDFVGEEGKRLNIFDMRNIDGDEQPQAREDKKERAQARYLRTTLRYQTDLAYIGLETGYTPTTEPDYTPLGYRWNYNSGVGEAGRAAAAAAGQGPPGKEPWIRRALEINPNLHVFVEAAVFDSLNHCAGNDDRKRRMPAEIADNFELRCYFAGHGSFRDKDAYPHVMRDIRDFIVRTSQK